MAKMGIIAGTAFRRIGLSEDANPLEVSTRFGRVIVLESDDIVFLPRHGMEDSIPPHQINHQAHLSAFKELGVPRIIGVNSVGSLKPGIPPKTIKNLAISKSERRFLKNSLASEAGRGGSLISNVFLLCSAFE